MPFRIVRDSIARIEAQALVNPASSEPSIGYGAERAIYEAAGKDDLLEARRRIGDLLPGQVAVTPGFALKAKYIIHTVGPYWSETDTAPQQTLYTCYANALALAQSLGVESIAFPLISSGHRSFPRGKAIDIAAQAIRTFLEHSDMMVTLLVYDTAALRYSQERFPGLVEFIHESDVRRAEQRKRERSIPDRFFERMAVPDEAALPCDLPEEKASVPSKPPVCRKSSLEVMIERSLAEETFQQRLFHLIALRGYTNVEIYKRANLTKQHFAKIKGDPDYIPKKNTAIALCMALQLDLKLSLDLLGRAGYTLSPVSRFDTIIKYFITHRQYDVIAVDIALFEHNLPALSNYA